MESEKEMAKNKRGNKMKDLNYNYLAQIKLIINGGSDESNT